MGIFSCAIHEYVGSPVLISQIIIFPRISPVKISFFVLSYLIEFKAFLKPNWLISKLIFSFPSSPISKIDIFPFLSQANNLELFFS